MNTAEKTEKKRNICPFLDKSKNSNCYYKSLTSITIPAVLKYCGNDFGICKYYILMTKS